MSYIFTNYPEVSDGVLEVGKKKTSPKHKKIKKLQKKLKKQEKIIQEMIRKASAAECSSTNNNESFEKSAKKKFSSWIGDALVGALPSIFRTIAKIVTSTICEYAMQCSMKAKVA